MVKTNNILRKLRFRELKSNLKNYLSVILIALLSVALFTGLSSNHDKLEASKNDLYQKSNMGDYFVTTSGYDSLDEFNTDDDFLKTLSSNITRRLYTQVNYNDKYLILAAYDNKEVSHEASIVSGGDGILISNIMASKFNLNTGDEIEITIPYDTSTFYDSIKNFCIKDDFLKSNTLKVSLKIDGIMRHSEAIDSVGSGGLVYLPCDTLKEEIISSILDNYNSDLDMIKNIITTTVTSTINDAILYNQFVLKSDNDIKGTIDYYFESKNANNLLLTMTPKTLPTNSAIESDVIQANQLLLVFPVVFYIVGILVIITSLSQLINKDKKIIGCMSSLGLSKWQIIMNYSFFACLIVFIGGIIGCIVGPLLIPQVMQNKYNVLYSLPQVGVNFFSIEMLLCFVILFVIALIASICVSYKIASLYPSKIFRDDSSTKNKGFMLKKHKFKFIPLPVKMSLRNLRNNLSRSIMVIVGVMGCSALLVCGFGIDNTLDNGINNDVLDKTPYDVYGEISSLDVRESINALSTIDKSELYLQTNTSLLNESKQIDSTLYVYEHGEIVKIGYSDTGATITTKIASNLGLSIGDEIKFSYNNNYYTAKIDNIEEMFFNHGIILSDKYLENLGLVYTPNRFYAISTSSEEILKDDLTKLDGVNPIMSMTEFLDAADNTLSGIRLITLTVKVFAIILAVVVIYNLALLNFKERIRDIATLKVLGFGQREVAQTLLVETSILTILGSLIGMLLGMPLLKLLLGINKVDAIEYLYHINFESYIYALLLTVIVGIVINFFITFYTNKIEMVESLKSVE